MISFNTDFFLSVQDDQTFLESITGFASLNYTVPACFISYNSSLNKPFALGGLQDTRSNIIDLTSSQILKILGITFRQIFSFLMY